MHNLYRVTTESPEGETLFYWFTTIGRANNFRQRLADHMGPGYKITREQVEFPESRLGLVRWLNDYHGRPALPRPEVPHAPPRIRRDPQTPNREHPHLPEPGTATPDARDIATPNPTPAGPAADLI